MRRFLVSMSLVCVVVLSAGSALAVIVNNGPGFVSGIGCLDDTSPGESIGFSRFPGNVSFNANDGSNVASCTTTDPTLVEMLDAVTPASVIAFVGDSGTGVCTIVSVSLNSAQTCP